ncbi:MAG: 7-cyano-7-deazaguanine synthase [Candidatus ainarchaeum sp.]|nr:7-cyano-7-deazaguanine synthase [Candidatus ainarchaeum sp.]
MATVQKIKAIGLLSGGLDSTLAVKLLQDQGIEVIALTFTSPFCLCNQKGKCYSAETAKKLGIASKVIPKGEKYLKLLRNPKHGYGSAMNPCIDCRIFILKEAKSFAKKTGAKFLFTGEVLGQRPMSQHFQALKKIEKEAGLEGKLLRPLSAKLLAPTEAEEKKWVDRNKLLCLQGRTRKPQFELAKKFGINDFPCPSGGCLLTYKEFAAKIRDLFKNKKTVSLKDIAILKIGRHFRIGKNKIIVGRNKEENAQLLGLKQKNEIAFEVPNTGSPVAILQGKKTKSTLQAAAQLTLRYSDCRQEKAEVEYWALPSKKKKIIVKQVSEKEIEKLRIQ